MIDLDGIRGACRTAIDLDYYDLLWTHQLLLSGEREAIQAALTGGVLSKSYAREEGELPDYPEIMPGVARLGIQNHGLINARINIEGLSMNPEVNFSHPDPIVREFNQAYITDRWKGGRWTDTFFMTGMEVEANGISSVSLGISDRRVSIRHVSNMDILWDRSHREPARWRWVCTRNRLTVDEAEEYYGHALTDEEFKKLVTKDEREIEGNATQSRREAPDQVVEWSYYDRDHHVVFLGSIQNGVAMALDGESRYQRAKKAGRNPFGLVPQAWWIDSWAPGVRRPVSKMDTTYTINSMLNEVEEFMLETCRRGLSLTAIDETKLDPEIAEDIRNAKGLAAIKELLVVRGGSINDVLSRTPPMEIPATAIHLYQILRSELNAATGVGDMQRGQALSGERTREEIRTLTDQSGVQARHTNRTFATFVGDVVNIARAIGAQYDRASTTLTLPTFGTFRTDEFPVAPFLSVDIPVDVNPSSLFFKTDQDRQNEAIAEFLQLHQPYIQMGVMDPMKSMRVTMAKFGYRDPESELGFSPEEQARRAATATMPNVQ